MKDSYDFTKGKRGAVVAVTGKTRITIFLDDEVVEAFRAKANAEGKGYQTLINEALRRLLNSGDAEPVTVGTLRKVLREELQTH